MQVALVHDFLTQLGGAERVLECFLKLFPNAPVYTLVYDEQKTGKKFKNYDVRTSFIQNLPGGVKKYKWYLPLMRRAIESFDLSQYDLVLSDSSAFAKGVIIKKPTRHISYIHTPTRYLWQEMDSYVATTPAPFFLKPFLKAYLKTILKPWDSKAAQRPDILIANSLTVKQRIWKYYQRDSTVIYPPVDTKTFVPQGLRRDYFLTASRLEPYKKIDLVIEAFSRLRLPLKVVGSGSSVSSIKYQVSRGNNIQLLGRVSDAELAKLMAEAKAFVFPALEDAGIMVMEALSCGTPVIGLAQGGTAEIVRDGETGVLFENQTVSDIIAAVKRFQGLKFNPDKLRSSILQYDREEFKKRILNVVRSEYSGNNS